MPRIAAVRVSRILLSVALVWALLVGGMLPAEHLHHSTQTRPQIVHSHLPPLHSQASTHVPGVTASEDDHHDAVSLDAQAASRVPVPPAYGSALVPHVVRVLAPVTSIGVIGLFEPRAPESPPLPSGAPRAPPAC